MTMIPTDGSEISEQDFSEETRKAPPANLLIKIESVSMLEEHEIRKYKSRAFEAGGYKWKLKLKFNTNTGDDEDEHEDEDKEDKEHIGVFISLAETSSLPTYWEVNAVITIFLYNHVSDNYLCFRDAIGTVAKPCRFHEIKSVYECPKMISKKMLMEPRNGFLSGDACAIGAEVFVIKSLPTIERVSILEQSKPYTRKWNVHVRQLLEMKGYWASPEFRTADHTWRVRVDQNVDVDDDRYVAIYLELVKPESQTVNVDICFRMENYITKHRSRELSSCWIKPHKPTGFPAFMKKTKLFGPSRGFIFHGGYCVLDLELSVLATGPYNGGGN